MPRRAAPDFTLSDGNLTFDFKLDGNIYQTPVSEDRALSIDLSAENKKIGEFDEQNSWIAGRGHRYLSKTPEGYYETQAAWTLNGILMSGLQWRYAKGIRGGEDFSLPGSVDWVQLRTVANSNNMFRYQSHSFVAGATVTLANYTAAQAGFWLKKVGKPGALSVQIDNDSTGDPGTTRASGSLTSANFPNDNLSHFVKISTGTTTLTNGTTYHVKIFGASTDNKDNHWQVAVSSTGAGKSSSNNTAWTSRAYGIYFWVANADVARRLFFFQYDGIQYAVSQNADNSTASKLYINGARGKATSATSTVLTDSNASFGTNSRFVGAYIRILRGAGQFQVKRITSHTNTALTVSGGFDATPSSTSEYVIFFSDVWTEITSPVTGLGVVFSRPVILGATVYFPQGATTNIRRMRFNAAASPPAHEFADDGTNMSVFLAVNSAGDRIYSALNFASVKSAPAVAWPTNLTFGTASTTGKANSRMNGMKWDENKNAIVAYKEDEAFSVDQTGKVTKLKYNFEDNQSYLNGVSSVTANGFTYFTRQHSLVQEYGATCQEVGLAWRGTTLKADRQGYFAALVENQGWIYCALDGYAGNLSSVNIYDGKGYHEIFQAPITGERVRDLQWQACEETGFNRLWIDVGGYVAYLDFPSLTNDPYFAAGVNYQHETVIESGVINKGQAARLLKHIKEVVAVTENLGTRRRIRLDYRIDDKVFTTADTDWIFAGHFDESPEDTVDINVSDIRDFRYRMVLITRDVNTPVAVRAIVPSGYARVPFKMQWTMRIKLDELKVTGSNDPSILYAWLTLKARSSKPLTMTSERYPSINGFRVVLGPPSVIPTSPERSRKPWRGVDTLVLQEV